MRIVTLGVIGLIVVGCKEAHHERSAPSTAPKLATAGAPASENITPATPAMLRLGAMGSSVHAQQLVARDDGGFVWVVDVFGKQKLATTTVEQKDDDPVTTVLAIGADGAIRWARPIDGHCTHVLAAPHGVGTFIAGTCSSPITTENGSIKPPKFDDHVHIFIAMLDDTGVITWSHYLGDPGTQVAYAAAVDGAGNAIIGGDYTASIDFGSGRLTAADREGFVASYDPAGKLRWVKHFPTGEVQALLATEDEIDVAGIFRKRTTIGSIALEAPKGGRFYARLGTDGEATAAFVVGRDASMNIRLVRAKSGKVFMSADSPDGVKLFAIDVQATELSTIKGKHSCLTIERELAIDANDVLWLETCVPDQVDFGDGPITGDNALSDVAVVKYDASGKALRHVVLAGPQLDMPGGIAIGKDGHAVVSWYSQQGPAGKSPHDWLMTEVYYSAALQKL